MPGTPRAAVRVPWPAASTPRLLQVLAGWLRDEAVMKVLVRRTARNRRNGTDDLPGITAAVRLDRRTKNLTKRLQPGEIAIIDHADLDRVAADALITKQAAAVVNVVPSITGRYPNLGPQLIVEAGIALVDNVGPDVFDKVAEGDIARLDGEKLYLNGQVVAKGIRQTTESVGAAMAEARTGLSVQIEAFAANTMEYIKRERELLIDGVGVPDLKTRLEGRHVLVVVRGYHYREDLAVLRPYIRDYRPVMLGVDGGADALLEFGLVPDIIVGDMDSVSDEALNCGAELVVHAYRDGRAPGLKRVEDLGLPCIIFPATGTSEDIALLVADDAGASLIVAVGTHASLDEFLDKGRSGMASTFLTRLRVGGKLVEPKGVSRLYRNRISARALLLLVLAAAAALFIAVYTAAPGTTTHAFLLFFKDRWDAFIYWLTGLFS
jgi:uncharacterized membrane-anchored protein